MEAEFSTASDTPKYSFLDSWWFILLVVNALTGIVLLEMAWKNTERFRNPVKELDDLFPAFRRNDAKNWKKWMHYPGAMTIIVPRVIVFIVGLLSTTIIIWCLMLCSDHRKPKSCLRKYLINLVHSLGWRFISFFSLGAWIQHKYIDCDYSEYLGTSEHQPNGASIGRKNKRKYYSVEEYSSKHAGTNLI